MMTSIPTTHHATVFFDTEFTSLLSDGKLISIGLVEQVSGTTFYAECSDTYTPSQCSAFCKTAVLPLLEGGIKSMTLSELNIRLDAWLAQFEMGTVLISDSRRDLVQLDVIFPFGLPERCSTHVVTPLDNFFRRIANIGRRVHKANNLRVHHALDDALANRIIFSSRLYRWIKES